MKSDRECGTKTETGYSPHGVLHHQGFRLFPRWKNCVYLPVRKKKKAQKAKSVSKMYMKYSCVCGCDVCVCDVCVCRLVRASTTRNGKNIDSKNKQAKFLFVPATSGNNFWQNIFIGFPS